MNRNIITNDMQFNENKAIYIQIAERIADEIMLGVYNEDERIPCNSTKTKQSTYR